jgi:hypothetical protein
MPAIPLGLGRTETEEEKEEEEVSSSVWEDNWDDDVIEDDFSNQLRYRTRTTQTTQAS